MLDLKKKTGIFLGAQFHLLHVSYELIGKRFIDAYKLADVIFLSENHCSLDQRDNIFKFLASKHKEVVLLESYESMQAVEIIERDKTNSASLIGMSNKASLIKENLYKNLSRTIINNKVLGWDDIKLRDASLKNIQKLMDLDEELLFRVEASPEELLEYEKRLVDLQAENKLLFQLRNMTMLETIFKVRQKYANKKIFIVGGEDHFRKVPSEDLFKSLDIHKVNYVVFSQFTTTDKPDIAINDYYSSISSN